MPNLTHTHQCHTNLKSFKDESSTIHQLLSKDPKGEGREIVKASSLLAVV